MQNVKLNLKQYGSATTTWTWTKSGLSNRQWQVYFRLPFYQSTIDKIEVQMLQCPNEIGWRFQSGVYCTLLNTITKNHRHLYNDDQLAKKDGRGGCYKALKIYSQVRKMWSYKVMRSASLLIKLLACRHVSNPLTKFNFVSLHYREVWLLVLEVNHCFM